VIFCAEQGFAGAFSERMLDAAGAEIATAEIFLIGSRGRQIASERGVKPRWEAPMPSHSFAAPKLAERISEALDARLASGDIDRLEAVFSRWRPGHGVVVERRRLFPLDLSTFPRAADGAPPLINLKAGALMVDLAADYVHAQLCNAALHAFAAENEARAEAMAAARRQIETRLVEMQSTQRVVRQDEITAEIIELAAGEAASRDARDGESARAG
jgi:F-type H+-transporting ATPase subunit gamma